MEYKSLLLTSGIPLLIPQAEVLRKTPNEANTAIHLETIEFS
jgi:hypothetical protein